MGQASSSTSTPLTPQRSQDKQRTGERKRPSNHETTFSREPDSGVSEAGTKRAKPRTRRTNNLPSTPLVGRSVSQSPRELSRDGKKRPPRRKEDNHVLVDSSKEELKPTNMPGTYHFLNEYKAPQNGQMPSSLAQLQRTGLNTIRTAVGLLEKHSSRLSRNAMASRRWEEHAPALSVLSLEELKSLKSCFVLLVEILREIHELIFPQDPEFALEVQLACSEAIISKAVSKTGDFSLDFLLFSMSFSFGNSIKRNSSSHM